MGIFDFFRKKSEIKIERIKINEFDSYICSMKKENKSRENSLFDSIKESLKVFAEELDSKNTVLRSINLNEKKADERAKFIIRENLSHYIDNLDKLVRELRELESEELASLIKDLDSLFISFEQKSRLNFEKATFLIGKELGDVKDSMNSFIRKLKENLEKNKSLLESLEILGLMDNLMKEFNEIQGIMEGIKTKVGENDIKIKSAEADILKTEIEIEKIKSSESYKKENEAEAEINVKKEELEKEVFKLKEMVDFKKLANIFHYDSKKMSVINEYKLNFLKTFERDRLLSLIPLLDKGNMNDSFISKKANEIMQKEKEIEKIKNQQNKKESAELMDLNKKLSILKSEIDFLKREIQREEKRKEKLEDSKSHIIHSIKQELAKINAELIV